MDLAGTVLVGVVCLRGDSRLEVWALLVTGVLIFRPARRRALGTATFLVALTLGICAVVGLFGPNSALQLWLVCAINLAYQAAHLRSA